MFNLWVDDLRSAPVIDFEETPWLTAKNSAEAISILTLEEIHWLSLDHDLGGDDIAYAIVMYMAEKNIWPNRISIHSANPVGVKNMAAVIRRYSPLVDDGYTGREFVLP